MQGESFASYLGRQYAARQGFAPAKDQEAHAFASPGDVVLTRADASGFTILVIVDRETYPNRRFDLPSNRIEAMGKDCLKYSGTGGHVFIRIIEISASEVTAQDRGRLSFGSGWPFGKVHVVTSIVDTTKPYVWASTKRFGGPDQLNFILAAFRALTGRTEAPSAPALPRWRFPFLTCLILALLALVFAGEVVFAVRPPTGALQADIETLIALGGLNRTLVLQKGEWYRVLTAPLMHLDLMHIGLNGIALLIAGNMLERLVGRAWLGALFVVGALGGSLMSLAVNPASLVSVGASGAIMGLFAGVLTLSLHLPSGTARAKLQRSSINILIPSLLPLATAGGHQVDYGAHFGGAIAGAVLGFVLLSLWPRAETWPRFRQAAFVIGCGGALIALACAVPIALNYARYALTRLLAPDHQFAGSEQDPRTVASLVTRDFPRDPRGHLLQARVFITAGNLEGAERELRTGLSEQDILKSALEPVTEASLRMLLAAVLYDKRQFDEAKAVGKPACTLPSTPQVRGVLDKLKLCD